MGKDFKKGWLRMAVRYEAARILREIAHRGDKTGGFYLDGGGGISQEDLSCTTDELVGELMLLSHELERS